MEQHDRPTAVCLVRPDVSGVDAPRHAAETQRHTENLGYSCLYTVRPPVDVPDPIGYALGIAAGLGVDAIVAHNLATVDNLPSRVCDMFDLETVDPPSTWAAVADTDPEHTHPDHAVSIVEAQRIMRQHIGCRALECARKATAYSRLVRAGKIVPPAETPRERAAARGIPFEEQPFGPALPSGPDMRTLLAVLDGLSGAPLSAAEG